MQEWPQRHRITVEHFYRMAEAGLFAPDERVELLNGEIIDLPAMGRRHAAVRQIVSRTVMPEGVIDILAAAGLKKLTSRCSPRNSWPTCAECRNGI
jgi:hypothetical protein